MDPTITTRKILISHFKKFDFPFLDKPFLEICNIQNDTNSDGFEYKVSGLKEIGLRNEDFGELATLYSFWKNDNLGDMTGLFHYRRFLTFNCDSLDGSEVTNKFWEGNYRSSWNKRKTFAESQIMSIPNYDNKVVLPNPRFISNGQNIWQDFVTAHPNLEDIFDKICELWEEEFPKSNIKNWFNQNSKMYLFNIFYAPKDFVDNWCETIFPILIKVDKEIRQQDKDKYSRWSGFVAERLFTFYVSQPSIVNNFEFIFAPVMHFKELDYEAKINNLSLQLSNAEKEIEGFVNSNSWKITKPLRQFVKMINKN